MKHYSSLKLSKLLKENGCELESEKAWQGYVDVKHNKEGDFILEEFDKNYIRERYKAYDILWDVCVRYAKEFFGKKDVLSKYEVVYDEEIGYESVEKEYDEAYIVHTKEIFGMILQDKPQEEIEAYIIANSIFFNKERICSDMDYKENKFFKGFSEKNTD